VIIHYKEKTWKRIDQYGKDAIIMQQEQGGKERILYDPIREKVIIEYSII
jgi:hypothetical protein